MSEEKIVSYKGFTKGWKCRDFQFEVGATYQHDGDAVVCESGFHACEYPLDVFEYYAPADSNFALVEQGGEFSRKGDDTKVASQTITVKASIDFAGLVTAAIEYTRSKCDPSISAHSTGDQGAASQTGSRGAASQTGYQGTASQTGDRGAASQTGYRGAASQTGDQGTASQTGDQGTASQTGSRGAASQTGDQGAASQTGYRGAASVHGHHSVAMATGKKGKAMAEKEGSAIVLVYRGERGEIVHIRASKAGENGIKAGVWYTLDSGGDFVEA